MKKSFNFTHLVVFVFGYFIFNIIVNFGKKLIFRRVNTAQPPTEERHIGFKTEPEKEVIVVIPNKEHEPDNPNEPALGSNPEETNLT